MTCNDKPNVAFVLSGGASLDAIQVGMLHALYERGIVPDLIVGTSAGAMNGAFIASRPQTAATAAALADVWRDLRRGQVFPLNPLTGLLGSLGARDHLVPASGLRKLIAHNVQHVELEELPIPLHVVAVDVISGEELRLSHGPVVDAVRASAAIPGVVAPVRWKDRTLMDGGVANKHADLARSRAWRRPHLRAADRACMRTGRIAARRARRRAARDQPAHAAPTDRRHRTSPERCAPDRSAAAMPAQHPADRLRPRRRAHQPRAARRT